MESVLSKSDDTVGHATIPFEIGVQFRDENRDDLVAEVGAGADIIKFRNHVDGVGYATAELIGRDDQVRNKLGNYELLIFHREDEEWGPDIISRLSFCTCDAKLNPGETMHIGSATPDGSTVNAFLFFNYGTFRVRGRKAGLLLCLGITSEELAACRSGKRNQVEKALKTNDVYPFTDLCRESAM